ncbi:MAG: chitobiase/beta-hexosaminidase C-terminal domain-containing protein [Prevotella sp.]|nr:chitobiase/beta-hexosaminidase C-terminal domain-containing protein [Prevotella sp.]MCM1074885.1 chitobiase/beta-hexosaminidase C-terminal domain-containing protein [Ruminococcus sp.]
MKKLLLSMAAVALSFTAANADEIELNANNATDIIGTDVPEKPAEGESNGEARHIQPLTSLSLGDYSFTFDKGNASTEPAYYYAMSTNENGQCSIRVYKNSSMTITAPAGVEITQIVFAGSKGQKDANPTVSTGTATATSASAMTWNGNASTITFTYTNNYRIQKMTITYGASDKETVAMPTFDPASGASFTDQLAVTINAAEGASVYYTLDGTNPTAESTKYEAPIVLTATTTIKAFAAKEGMNDSGIATATFTKDESVETLADIIAAGLDGDETTEFTYSGEAVVTYVNGSNMYVEDSSAALLVYGKLNTTYTQGDVLTGFKGTFKNYNGTYELMATASSFGEPVKTQDVTPQEFTIGTINATTDQNKYIVLRDVTVDGENLTLTEGTDEIAMYNKFKVEIPAGTPKKDVVGIISYFGTKDPVVQIYPIQFNEPTGIETVAADSASVEVYSINGIRMNADNLPAGIYVVRQGEKVSKVVVK